MTLPFDLAPILQAGTVHAVLWFGSSAAGCSDARSDIDLLIIGDADHRLSPPFDVIWMPPAIADARLPGSELGAHLSFWAHLLHGDARYLRAGPPHATAIARKVRHIHATLLAADAHASTLDTTDLQTIALRIRRDLQRFDALSAGIGPSPRPLLDAHWSATRHIPPSWVTILQYHPLRHLDPLELLDHA